MTLPWREVRSYLRLIADDRDYDRRFRASLAGVELEDAPSGASAGNSAWQQAMRMKREISRR